MSIVRSKIGEGTVIPHEDLVNIYDATIGTNCKIGTFVDIGGATIGDNCKISSFAFIPPGIKIGNNVFIGPHVCFTNDKHPRAVGEWKVVETIVDDGASIGAGSVIVCGSYIGKGAMVGAGSTISGNVEPDRTYYGHKAIKRK